MANCGCSSTTPIVVPNLSDYVSSGGSGTVESVGLASPNPGLAVGGDNPVTTSGTITIELSDDMAAIEALAGTGFLNRTGVNTWALSPAGTVTSVATSGPGSGFTVTGGPITTAGTLTFALIGDLAALEALSGTNTIYYRSGVSIWTPVTIGPGLTFTGGVLSADNAPPIAVVDPVTGNDVTARLDHFSLPFATVSAAVAAAETESLTKLVIHLTGADISSVTLDTLDFLIISRESTGSITTIGATAGATTKTIIGNGLVDIDTWTSASTVTDAPAGVTLMDVPILTVITTPTALSGHAGGNVTAISSSIQTIDASGATGTNPNGNGGKGGDIQLTRSTLDTVVHDGGDGTGAGNGGNGGDMTITFSQLDTAHDAKGGAGTVAGTGGNLTQNFSYIGVDDRSGLTTPTATVKREWPPYKDVKAAGTAGAQTINRLVMSVNIAAGQTSVVITNSFYKHPVSGTDGTIAIATVRTLDATALTARISSAADGAFTVTLNAAATAETRVDIILSD